MCNLAEGDKTNRSDALDVAGHGGLEDGMAAADQCTDLVDAVICVRIEGTF